MKWPRSAEDRFTGLESSHPGGDLREVVFWQICEHHPQWPQHRQTPWCVRVRV
jgi:hypothetical protein